MYYFIFPIYIYNLSAIDFEHGVSYDSSFTFFFVDTHLT